MAVQTVTTRCSECGCILTAEVDYEDLKMKEEEKGRIRFFTLECLRCGYTDTPIPPEKK